MRRKPTTNFSCEFKSTASIASRNLQRIAYEEEEDEEEEGDEEEDEEEEASVEETRGRVACRMTAMMAPACPSLIALL